MSKHGISTIASRKNSKLRASLILVMSLRNANTASLKQLRFIGM